MTVQGPGRGRLVEGEMAEEFTAMLEGFAAFGLYLHQIACPTAHASPVPVDSVVDGARLAYLCPDCDTQLPPDWRKP